MALSTVLWEATLEQQDIPEGKKKTLCRLPLYFLPLASVRLRGLMLLANKEVARLLVGDEALFLKGLTHTA